MKKYAYVLLNLIIFSNLYSQDSPSVEKNQFKINILLPGFVYEHGFTTKNTLYSEISFGIGYRNNDYYGSEWSFYPTITEQFRHYYNLDRRTSKGKVTVHNSGGFVALHSDYRFKAISTNDALSSLESSFTIGTVWGFERTYRSNFNLGLNMGAGYNVSSNSNDSGFVPVLGFSLGWVIGK
ncbi:hypothetical protein [Flavobacterium sp. 5]|uniref:hypothetical protein n=1 Tax=Flavobacterium sp. 5 TaxID=2035199 RepID=UPI000C2CD332|nr:hypothetical protein [Flavobacterium sp. 5]PKB18870.1 hypothetical protein CLU82_4165 [Flavobacterium sp. 5]